MSGTGDRLSMLQAAFVVARRDFVAILFSRAFFFFLLGPLFPLGIEALAGGIGQRVENGAGAPQIGIAMNAYDVDAMRLARDRLATTLGPAGGCAGPTPRTAIPTAPSSRSRARRGSRTARDESSRWTTSPDRPRASSSASTTAR